MPIWDLWDHSSATQSGLRSSPAAVSWAEGRLDVFCTNNMSQVMHQWYSTDRGWSRWGAVGGSFRHYGTPAVISSVSNHLQVFVTHIPARSNRRDIAYRDHNAGIGRALNRDEEWELLGADMAQGANPIAATDDRLHGMVMCRWSDNSLRLRVYSGGFGEWEQMDRLVLSTDPAAVGTRSGTFIFAVDDNHELHYCSYPQLMSWTNTGVRCKIGAQPFAFNGIGGVECLVRGEQDQLVRVTVRNEGVYKRELLGIRLGGDPSGVRVSRNTVTLFARDLGGNLLVTWLGGTNGSRAWKVVPASMSGRPSAVSWADGRTDVFVWSGTVGSDDGRCYHLWGNGGQFWEYEDLQPLANAADLQRLIPQTAPMLTEQRLRARIRDPLWMLCRQWQVGEFQGEDSARAAHARLVLRRAPLRPDDALSDGPLETAVSGEPVPLDVRTRAQLGQAFARSWPALAKALLENGQAALQMPPASALAPFAEQRMQRLLAGRVLDGAALLARTGRTAAALSAELGEGFGPSVDALLTALATFADQHAAQLGLGQAVPAASWDPEALRHRVRLTAPGGVHLDGQSDADGALDWYAFDAQPGEPAWGPDETRLLLPSRVELPGMPSPRWWDFEDSAASLLGLSRPGQELARLVWLDFMLVHGHDWFSVPVTVQLGSLVQVRQLRVVDTFGDVHTIRPAEVEDGERADHERWSMFRNVQAASPTPGERPPVADWLLIPDSAATHWSLGPTLEELHLVRDEAANLAWAIERKGSDGTGRPVDIRPEPQAENPPPSVGAPMQYVRNTPVPTNHYPFVSLRLEDLPTIRGVARRGEVALVQARLALDDRDRNPRTNLLTMPEGGPYILREEALPRAGLRVRRVLRRVRLPDGTAHTCVLRVIAAGTRELPSGLRFDLTERRKEEG